MRLGFDILLVLVGVALVARAFKREWLKDPMLYFGLYALLDGGLGLMSPMPTLAEDLLGLLSTLALLVAAVLMFAFAEPAKAKSEPKDS